MNSSTEAKKKLAEMAIPSGSLGLLGRQAVKLFTAWQSTPEQLRPLHLIFAADNGIVEEGVVRQSQDITYRQAQNMAAGKAVISVFCQTNNIPYQVIDVGINNDLSVGINRKTAKGTKNFLKEPAMTREEYQQAFASGQEMVSRAKDCNLISLGEMGIGNTTTSSAVLHGLTQIAPEFIVGCGANAQYPEVIKRKREVVAAAGNIYGRLFTDPAEIIRCVGGFDIAAMCGAMLACKQKNIPFVLDGFITAAAFACAVRMDPSISDYGFASHMSREPGMAYALHLGGIEEAEVPIRADLALGEGSGAVLAVTMLRPVIAAICQVPKMSELTEPQDLSHIPREA